MVVFDTYAWIEYFIGSEKGQKVRDILTKEGGKTPSIVLGELARKYLREGFEKGEIRKRLEFVAARTEIIGIDIDVSLRSAELYIELFEHARKRNLRTPSLADALIYAIALLIKEKLLTGDKLFEGLPKVEYMGD